MVLGELKTKLGKGLFKKLNEHSKEFQSKQEEIIKKHNSLSAQHEELEHLKVNMNDYLGRDKTDKQKESVIEVVKKYKSEDRKKDKGEHKVLKEVER